MPDYIGEIIMRSGDTVPLLAVAVEDDMGVPVDLTGATSVDVMLTNEDGEDPRAVVTGPVQPQLVLPGSITDPVNGLVTYDWALDLVLRPGVVQLVVVAHFPTGPISAPSDRTASITVRPDALLPPGGITIP